MASAAGPRSASTLLEYLATTGWLLDVRHAGGELSATAERGQERIVAWARTTDAVALVLFEQACGSPSFGARG